jgi:hypothetical protein
MPSIPSKPGSLSSPEGNKLVSRIADSVYQRRLTSVMVLLDDSFDGTGLGALNRLRLQLCAFSALEMLRLASHLIEHKRGIPTMQPEVS